MTDRRSVAFIWDAKRGLRTVCGYGLTVVGGAHVPNGPGLVAFMAIVPR